VRSKAGSAEPIYFERAEDLRAWFEANHETADELWIGYHKKRTGRPTVSWSDTVDEALSFGWIDGIRYSLDDDRFMQRLTPRRAGSNWSAINIAKVERLLAEGRMRPAGIAAFERRRADRSAVYSYERRHEARLTDEELATFRRDAAAWEWFGARPASYRTAAVWWVVSAKRPETRERRLTALIEDSAAGRTPKALTPPGRQTQRRPEKEAQ
jgi:uncharacterized protein YdeI (YjbR/CyaY-like superfamily)